MVPSALLITSSMQRRGCRTRTFCQNCKSERVIEQSEGIVHDVVCSLCLYHSSQMLTQYLDFFLCDCLFPHSMISSLFNDFFWVVEEPGRDWISPTPLITSWARWPLLLWKSGKSSQIIRSGHPLYKWAWAQEWIGQSLNLRLFLGKYSLTDWHP